MQEAGSSLAGKSVAVPENRQLLLLSEMLSKRGAQVIAVPLVMIYDAPDPQPVLAWLKSFIAQPPDLLILLTGEGLRRLLKLARKNGLEDDFIAALAHVSKLCRGPKPNKALREIDLNRDIDADSPTTDGVIASLEKLEIQSRRVAVQLYGEEPNHKLIDYLNSRGAEVSTVAPYVYSNRLDEEKVVELLENMAAGSVDVIAFTSKPQVKRLMQVVQDRKLEEILQKALQKSVVAAVGPVVAETLKEQGIKVDIMPERTFFMKPMVTAIGRYLEAH